MTWASFRSRFVSVLLLGLVVWLGITAGRQLQKWQKIQEEVERARDEIAQIQKENEAAAKLIQSFQGQETIELEARRRLNVKKPGEEVVIIIPSNESDDAAGQQTSGASRQAETPPQKQENASDELRFIKNIQAWWKFVFK